MSAQQFQLLETILYVNGMFYLENYHIQRLYYSAVKLNFCHKSPTSYLHIKNIFVNIKTILVNKYGINQEKYCIRILLNKNGSFEYTEKKLSSMPIQGLVNNHVQLILANNCIDNHICDKNIFLWQHKTSIRNHYEEICKNSENEYLTKLNATTQISDVVLYNKFAYITEASKANLAIINKNNEIITPHLQNFLLAGTMRQYLLNHNIIKCDNISISDLKQAKTILYFNSLRGIYKAQLNLY
jgi:branched-subunit amino acid aminotransferase/4-amino-4-deoxychorismate lyase